MMMKNKLTYQMARWYCFSCGFSVIPLKPRSKQRLLAGTTFQTWYPRDDHLKKWFCTPQPYGIAIVPGEVSGNLVILDFDEFSVYQVWASLVPGALECPIVQSARGVHVYVRLQTMPFSQSFTDGMFEGLIFGQIIARGTITAPPSVHPSGHVYQWAGGDPRHVPVYDHLSSIGIERVEPERRPAEKPLHKRPVNAEGIASIEAYVYAAIRGEQQHLLRLTADSHNRNNQLFRSALKLSKYLDLAPARLIETELEHTARQIGLAPDEIGATIQRGLRYGVAHGVLQRR